MYLLRRAQYLESRSHDLFSLVAKEESEKRSLMNFLEQLKEIEKEDDDARTRKEKIIALKNNYEEKRKLSLELEKYTKNDSSAHEFLLNILTLNDLIQIKLMAKAITGDNYLSEKLLKEDISFFEIYVKNRKLFLDYTRKIFEKIRKNEEDTLSNIEVRKLKEIILETKKEFKKAS